VTTRVLFRDTILGGPVNRAFSVMPNPPAQVQLKQIPFPPPGWMGR